MGLRIIDKSPKRKPIPTSEAEQLSYLWNETQKWQEFHRNEDVSTQEEFIEKYKIVKKRLANITSPGENMVNAAEKLNLQIRKKKQNPMNTQAQVDVATLIELLQGDT
jgi:hypothetical protein